MHEGEPDRPRDGQGDAPGAAAKLSRWTHLARLLGSVAPEGREQPRWAAYLVALGITGLAVGLRRTFDAFGEDVVPFALFYPAVLASTLLGGVGPGLVSLLVSALAVTVFWLDPRGALAISGISVLNFVLFAVTAAATVLVADRLRRAHERLRRNEERLSLAQKAGGIGIWDWDLASDRLWWSPSFYAAAGIDPSVSPSIAALVAQIHPIDRERVASALERARQGLERLDIEFRLDRSDGNSAWLVGRADTFCDGKGRPSRLVGVAFDATRIRTAESERDQAHTLLETFFEVLPGAAYAKDGEGRFLLGNPGFQAAVGHAAPSFIGKTDLDLLADKDQARAIMEHDRALIRQGTPQSFEEDLVLPDGRLTHWLSVKSPIRSADGQFQGLVGVSLDITERRKAEERLRYLANEVDHRARNLLGVVLSVVRLTKVDDVAAFRAAVTGRIKALSRAHSLLAASQWQGVDLATLAAEELAPFERAGGEAITISGPAIRLVPDASRALAMALHELASNAAQHGALSGEAGRVALSWRVSERDGPPQAEILWRETGGPPVEPPARTGFGFTAIQGAIEHQLCGKVDLEWAGEGLVCRIGFPLVEQAEPVLPAVSAPRAKRPPSADAAVTLKEKRVLIVDDEALIALTMKQALQEQGSTVVGPARSSAAALDLIRQQAPDLAILDLNLAGRSSVSIARALRALGVPYVYCTGYADPAQMIEPELRAETLTKPTDPRELVEALRRALAGKAAAGAGIGGPVSRRSAIGSES